MQRDEELLYKLRELTATLRMDIGNDGIFVEFRMGCLKTCTVSSASADIVISAPVEFWEKAAVCVRAGQNLPLSCFHSSGGATASMVSQCSTILSASTRYRS